MYSIVLMFLLILNFNIKKYEQLSEGLDDRQQNAMETPHMDAGIVVPEVRATHIVGQPDVASPAQREPDNQLEDFVPAWIRDEGDFYRERIQVGGQWVERVRGRYAWDNGSEVEVEVSDLGEYATDDQLMSLGFNLDMETDEESRILRKQLDNDRYLANLEYDEKSREGMIQYAVKNRYLLEVKLQNLPLESFRVLRERDGTLQGLLDIR